MSDVKTHPVQTKKGGGWINAEVTKRAFEVYAAIYGGQSLERINERSGLGTGEIIAFLYAYPFPRAEWSARVREAFAGMQNI